MRRAGVIIGLLVLVAALAVVFGTVLGASGSPEGVHVTAAHATHRPAAPPDAGAFTLASLAGADPHAPLAHPPRAALLFNVHTGAVLWERAPYEHLRIASLTKMMTALIVAEHTRERERVRIVPRALHVGGSRLGFLPVGRTLPVRTLLYALLLPSANDAANELAVHVAGSLAGFVAMMNEHAAAWGLHCTHYSAPSGFINQRNYSCPHDLAELAARILANRRLARIVRTARIELPFPPPEHEIELVNNNPLLLYGYRGTLGVKTGYTEEAGRCLVAAARRGDVTLGVVLLHSNAPGGQARNLFEWAFDSVYHLPPVRTPALPVGA